MNIAHLRFLVVEDHGFQRWVTGNLLEGLGAKEVFSAADGQAALDLLAELDPPIDIIVTDLDMPGMDGMEFIRHLGELVGRVSLIVASSMDRSLIASVETMARAYGVNLLGAIEKPATARKLESLISLHRASPERKDFAKALSFTGEEIAAGLKRNEFEPFFQPKVEMRTRRLVGAEANARWRHPQHGVLPPKAFLAALESNGLIEDLTDAILKAAAFNCRVWHNAGVDISVSVNLSLTSLTDVTIADRMMNVVDAQGLAPRHVIFEVTESAAAIDLGRSLENLSRLRMKGFGLSIDDYGTGYSSMQRLAGVPFTELKIDQSFVKNAATQASSRAMLESSLELAKKLNIAAVAEGVENQGQWELLMDLDCQLAQGYFIARPMEAGGFLDWALLRRQTTA
jgi:EAL domain-containing protein (putative c-di-GMP-specific phosphodiesterase class I)/AmiR/NasT family two-component response regulator